MEKIRKALSVIPPWMPTTLTVVLILWLTLAPDPLGDEGPTLFEGADKIVHAIMFGFLTFVMLLDRQRSRQWKRLSSRVLVMMPVIASLLGIAVEVAQLLMGLGRGFEITDMIADIIGAVLAAFAYRYFQHRFL